MYSCHNSLYLQTYLVQLDQAVNYGIYGQAGRRVYVQFLGYVATVRHDGIHGDEHVLGNLLVGKALHHLHNNLLLTIGQAVGGFCTGSGNRLFIGLLGTAQAHLVLQTVHALGKEVVLQTAMAEHVLLHHVDVHQHLVEQLHIALGRIVLDEDVLQFRRTLLDTAVVVLMAVAEDMETMLRVGQASCQQLLHIGMHVVVFIVHVARHLGGILVIEFKYQHGNLVAGHPYGLQQLALYGRQTEVYEIGVRLLQVLHQSVYVHVIHQFADLHMVATPDEVHDSQERGHIHTTLPAHGLYAGIAKAECQSEAADHLQHAVVVAYQFTHGGGCSVLVGHNCIISKARLAGNYVYVFLAQSYK